jgi:hypothetical protein
MEVCRRLIRYYTNDIFRFYPLGDIHGGTLHCAEDKVRRKFADITSDDFALWLDMGDSLDCITPTDPRWQSKIMAPWMNDDENIAENGLNWYCDLTGKAVAAKVPHGDESRCLGKIEGNHEWEMRRHKIANMQKNICNRLDIPNLGFSCFYHLVFQRMYSNEKHMFRFHITHGSGNAQTSGGRTQKLRKIMNQTDALYTIVGHMHDIKIESPPILSSGNDLTIKGRSKIGVITGSFLKTYTQGVEAGYGEHKNYDPTPLGCIVFEIIPGEEMITAKPSYA